jgi:glycosyltransferase involved in cell wall biosynthesis
MPSQEEGFPRVILEAMASGIPIVASNVGSVAEIVPSSVKPFILHSDDTMGFARALNRILSQTPEEKQALRKELRAGAEDFSTDIVAEKFINLFR